MEGGKKTFGLICICLLFVVCDVYADGPLEGCDKVVDDNGTSGFTTISDALQDSSAGDTICVRGGHYMENLDIKNRVVLKGVDGRDQVTVSATDAYDHVLEIWEPGTIVKDMTLNGTADTSYKAGIWTNASNTTLWNVNITYCDFGIYLDNADGSLVTGNIIDKVGEGVHIDDSDNVNVSYNTIGDTTTYSGYDNDGIVAVAYAQDITGVIIQDNTIQLASYPLGVWRDGATSFRFVDFIISNNLIQESPYNPIWIERLYDSTIQGNHINDSDSYIETSSNITITGNLITPHGFIGTGIQVSDSIYLSITGNTIMGFPDTPGDCLTFSQHMYLDNVDNTIIQGNDLTCMYYVEVGPDSENIIFQDNNVTNANALLRITNSVRNLTVRNNRGQGLDRYLDTPFSTTGEIYIYNNLFNASSSGGSMAWDLNLNTTRTLGRNIVGGPWIGGNYWTVYDGNGHSDTCQDVGYDWFCDTPFISDSVDHLALKDHHDTSPPYIQVSSPINASYAVMTLDLNVSIIDAITGEASRWYSLDGGSNTSFTGNATLAFSTEGQHSITVYSNDTGGYLNHTTLFFTIDMTAPSTDDDAPHGWQTSPYNVTLTASDGPGSGIFATYFRIDGGGWETGTTAPVLDDGNHTIDYYSTDNAGNTEDTRTTYAPLDAHAPHITIYSPVARTYDISVVQLNASSNEDVLSWWYSLDGNSNVSFTPNTTLADIADGDHTLMFHAKDSAGNLNVTSISFRIETSPPIIDILSPGNITYKVSHIDLDYTVDKTVSWAGYSLDDGPNITLDTNTGLKHLEAGHHCLVIHTNDTIDQFTSKRVCFGVEDVATAKRSVQKGTNVMVDIKNQGMDYDLMLTFLQVSDPGDVRFTTMKENPVKTGPAGFKSSGRFFEVSVNATFDNFVTVCVSGFDVTEDHRFFHSYDETWEDITSFVYPDIDSICGEVTSFSPFAVLERGSETEAITSAGGGGGGGGGPSKGILITKIVAGSAGDFLFDLEDTVFISGILMRSKDTVYNVKVAVEALVNKPYPAMADPRGAVLSYLRITKTGISEAQVEDAHIIFRVPILWLKENDINMDSVFLEHYQHGRWETLETTYENEDADHAYFRARTPGFSYFAIIGITGSGYRGEALEVSLAKPAPPGPPLDGPGRDIMVERKESIVETRGSLTSLKTQEEGKGICGPSLMAVLALFPSILRKRRLTGP